MTKYPSDDIKTYSGPVFVGWAPEHGIIVELPASDGSKQQYKMTEKQAYDVAQLILTTLKS